MPEFTASNIVNCLRSDDTPAHLGRVRLLMWDDPVDPTMLIARDDRGWAVLGVLVDLGDRLPDMRAESAELLVQRSVTVESGATRGPFTLIGADTAGSALEPLAAALFEGLIELAGTSSDDFAEAAAAFVEEFQTQAAPTAGLEAATGLFGELVVMHLSSNVDAMVSAWHESPFAVHDFSIGSERLEVKSTQRLPRLHWFSRGQLTPSTGEVISIASIYAPFAAGGTSILDLVQSLGARCSAASAALLHRKLAPLASVNSSVTFDLATAAASMWVVPSGDVPAVAVTDPRIRSVKYQAELSSNNIATASRTWQTIFGAGVP